MLSSEERLDNHGGGVGGLVLEVGWEHLSETVVTRETVDAGLDEDKTELGVLVLKGRVRVRIKTKGYGLLFHI